MTDEGLRGIARVGVPFALVLALLAEKERARVALDRAGAEVGHQMQQVVHARAGPRADKHDRHQVRLAQRLLERVVQLILGQCALLQVHRHQVFIDLHDLVDELLVPLADRTEPGARPVAVFGLLPEIDHVRAVRCRQVQRQALLAERVADLLDERRERAVLIGLRIDLVDDDHPRQPPLRRHSHHAPGRRLDAALGIDDDGAGLDRREHAERLTEEVGKAGSVDEIKMLGLGLVVGEVKVDEGRVETVPVLLLFGFEVADGVFGFDAAGFPDHLGRCEDGLDQRGLARSGVSGEGNVADKLRGVAGHAWVLRGWGDRQVGLR